jgi:hypothetical protein
MIRPAKNKPLVVRAARATRHGMWVSGRSLVDEVSAAALRLPVRDQQTLRRQFPGQSPDQIADALVRASARSTGAVGAAIGLWAVLPIVPAFPLEVAAETLAVVGIEIKLVAELHEVYGMGLSGPASERMAGYLAAWAGRYDAALTPVGLALAASSPLRKQISRRLARRAGRSTLSLAPLLIGAVAGALLNRRETRRVGRNAQNNLRQSPAAQRAWA